jgi:uncharacterized membrane protein YebE (DUF533 family)
VFNATVLLGQLLQAGLSNSTRRRLDQSMGPEGIGQPDGPLRSLLGPLAGEDGRGYGERLEGLAETAEELIGGQGSAPGVDSLAHLGASTSAVAGGDGARPGALGKAARALLSGLALSALDKQRASGEGHPAQAVAPGLHLVQAPAEATQPEQSATLILAAMINAAKADGQVDQEELQRIIGKLRAAGASADALNFVLSELRTPMDLDGLICSVPSAHLAVELYAASLLAIEMDTDAERQYLRRLAHGLGLEASVVRRVHQCLDVEHA